MLAVQEHAYLPLAELQSKSGMVEHVIAYENYPRDQQISASVSAGEFGFQVESVEALEQTPYDLNVVFCSRRAAPRHILLQLIALQLSADRATL